MRINFIKYLSYIPTVGGICLIAYSVYQAINGDLEYLETYILPFLILGIIFFIIRKLYPGLFIEGQHVVNRVNSQYGIESKIGYIQKNHELWISNYSYYKQRFIAIVTVILLIMILVKGAEN